MIVRDTRAGGNVSSRAGGVRWESSSRRRRAQGVQQEQRQGRAGWRAVFAGNPAVGQRTRFSTIDINVHAFSNSDMNVAPAFRRIGLDSTPGDALLHSSRPWSSRVTGGGPTNAWPSSTFVSPATRGDVRGRRAPARAIGLHSSIAIRAVRWRFAPDPQRCRRRRPRHARPRDRLGPVFAQAPVDETVSIPDRSGAQRPGDDRVGGARCGVILGAIRSRAGGRGRDPRNPTRDGVHRAARV